MMSRALSSFGLGVVFTSGAQAEPVRILDASFNFGVTAYKD